MKKNIALIFAGGIGSRMGKISVPKQFLEIDEVPILIHTINYFQEHELIDGIYIVMKDDYIEYTEELVEKYKLSKVLKIVKGGATGQDSIFEGLSAIASENDQENTNVLIHDGVRPVISSKIITNNINSVNEYGTGITSVLCNETVILSSDGKVIENAPRRDNCFLAQAPQSFILKDILDLHKKERNSINPYDKVVDSASLFFKNNMQVHLVEGERGNIKVTTLEDYCILSSLLKFKKEQKI